MHKAFIELHSAIFLAGFTGVFGRLITLNESLLVFYRVLVTLLCLLVCFAIFHKPFLLPFARLRRIALSGFLLAVHWLLFFASIKYSNVSIGVVCFATVGFFTAILAPLVSAKKFDVLEIVLSLLTIAGIVLIFHFSTQYRLAISMGLASSFFYVCWALHNKAFSARYDRWTFVFWQMFFCWLVVGAAALGSLLFFRVPFEIPSGMNILWLLIMGSLCTALLQYLNIAALEKLHAFTVSLSFNLEPVYSIVIAMLLFHEHREVNFSFYLGLALIVLSVALQTLRQRAELRRQEPSKA